VRGSVSVPVTALTTTTFDIAYTENEFTSESTIQRDSTATSMSAGATLSSRLFSLGVRGSRSENQVTRVGPSRDQLSDSLSGTVTLSFRPIRWLGVGVEYSHLERSFTGGGKATENRGSLTLSASF